MPGYPGKQGRKPKPTALKLLEGNPGKRALNEREPSPPVRLPPAPSWLSGAAKRKYRKLGRQLVDQRVLTELDGDALARYCQIWARMVAAEAKLSEFGDLVKTAAGGLAPSPYLRIVNTSHDQLRQLEAEFGLTPASRVRIKAAPPEKEHDPFAEFLSGAAGGAAN